MAQHSSDPPASLDKDALIERLLGQVADLTARLDRLAAENAALRARVAELEEKLGQPPKTPVNSSTPPSQGRKASSATAAKPKSKPHKGAHRALHPNPTHKREMTANHCQHCGADVSAQRQWACEAYDHIEIPPIEPVITRMGLSMLRQDPQGRAAFRYAARFTVRRKPSRSRDCQSAFKYSMPKHTSAVTSDASTTVRSA